MKEEKIRQLIKAAKKLRQKKINNQITKFEKEELKEIYKQLLKK